MSRPKARRDFVLDSGGVSHLTKSPHRAAAWLERIGSTYDEPAVLVPLPVLSECLTGNPRQDAPTRQLLRRLNNEQAPDECLLHLTLETVARSAALRTRAISSRPAGVKGEVSPVDAQVVALAEERSAYRPVAIVTSDPDDIQLLVDLTGQRNIAVLVV